MKFVEHTTIRFKLALNMISVVLVAGVGAIIIGVYVINDTVVHEAYDTVKSSLTAVNFLYTEKIKNKHRVLVYFSKQNSLPIEVLQRNRSVLYKKLNEIRKEFHFDILNITDQYGRVIIRANNFAKYNDDVSHDTYIKWIQRNEKACYGTDIMHSKMLKRESDALWKKARIPLIVTERARQRNKKVETRAMVLKTAAPIFYKNKVIGIIYGIVLLNKNFNLVDNFKHLIFKEEKVDGADVGTTTIFLEDLRIATNVLRKDGKRAIGTQVSKEVYRAVFEKGETWLDKAFVVNKWYLSGYQPIYDIEKKIIGILFVGILKKKYDTIMSNTTIYFLFLILFTIILAVLLSIILINNVSRPIQRLIQISLKIAKGDYSKIEIKQRYPYDIQDLCKVFNSMVDAITERDHMIKEHTEKKLFQSEKLASLGRLASGIAHEINNPLTGILTYSSLLYDDFKGTTYEEDLLVIKNETLRCRDIVKEVLDFARETVLEKKWVNINQIINETMTILEKHVNFQNIEIVKELTDDMPEVLIDINQIKSVINNLALNAADAMGDKGVLTIQTRLSNSKNQVIVVIRDSGVGIPEENLLKIFDPFFTTKETGKGTGLGLSVTYGIIKRHNGRIDVNSVIGKGTEFTIELPITVSNGDGGGIV